MACDTNSRVVLEQAPVVAARGPSLATCIYHRQQGSSPGSVRQVDRGAMPAHLREDDEVGAGSHLNIYAIGV